MVDNLSAFVAIWGQHISKHIFKHILKVNYDKTCINALSKVLEFCWKLFSAIDLWNGPKYGKLDQIQNT